MIVKVENEVALAEMRTFYGEYPIPPFAKREVEMDGTEWNLIADAVEKQIPMKAKTISQEIVAERECPKCKNRLHEWFAPNGWIRDNYCSQCGQKMEW